MKPVIYQLVVRTFGNTNTTNAPYGDLATNGCGRFADINEAALQSLRALGVTHLWLTGVIRQATLTDHSAIGLSADPPDIVKGIAGSFYAIRDYYDVCPDYAVEPANRMREFEDLVARIQAAGLQVLIDLVPNHVSRAYASHLLPERGFGLTENTSAFFDPQNHFFYLVDPPNRALRLSKPPEWNPPGATFTGSFPAEDGSPGHPPKVSGNNCLDPSPSVTDWYETIKLNYGFDFASGRSAYEPTPATWRSIDEILAYWQGKGVDGFRCDFAHYVPAPAWKFLTSSARARRPAYFFAEAYPYEGSHDPIHAQAELIEAGFNAVYHYQSYNALKRMYFGASFEAFDREIVNITDPLRRHLVDYLENHDERRIASPIVPGPNPGDSGFGSADAGYHLAPLQFLSGPGPVLLLNGQEVGEPAAGGAGFAGDNGRTTIFDYAAMPEFVKWVGTHTYDGAALDAPQSALRAFYAALLELCQSPSAQGGGVWSLRYFNNPWRFPDCPAELYAFARFEPGSGEALIVACNLRDGAELEGRLRLPHDLITRIALPADVAIDLVLDRGGPQSLRVADLPCDDLETGGFAVSIPNQTSHVYSVRPAASV